VGALLGALDGAPVGGLVGCVGVGPGVVGAALGAGVNVQGSGGFQQYGALPTQSSWQVVSWHVYPTIPFGLHDSPASLPSHAVIDVVRSGGWR
jgi:hypothetical protein